MVINKPDIVDTTDARLFRITLDINPQIWNEFIEIKYVQLFQSS